MTLQIILRSKEFVTDVMGDDALQKEGGMAIFNSVSHALKPGLWRWVECVVISSISCVHHMTIT